MQSVTFLLIIPEEIPCEGMCSLSNQPIFAPRTQAFSPDQTVQTGLGDGEWMYLQAASDATGLSEKTLRRYIKKGQIKAKRLGKQTNSPLQVLITKEFVNSAREDMVDDSVVNLVDAEDAEIDDSVVVEHVAGESFAPDDSQDRRQANYDIQQIVRAMADQFAEKLDQQKEMLVQMRQELHEKEIQLRLLPDLQRKLDEKEKNSVFHTAALSKQIEELKLENERLRQESEAAKAEQRLPWWNRLFGGFPAKS